MATKSKNKKVNKSKSNQPKRKEVKSSRSKKSEVKIAKVSQSFSLTDVKKQIRLDESYISLVLGFGVVIVIFVVAIFFLKGENTANRDVLGGKEPKPTAASSPTSATKPQGKSYVMQENESLWDIAVREYGDGFAYTRIIEANNFENPDYVPPGTKIIIPPAK